MAGQNTNLESVTITVGQKKSTNYSKESFDANESITLAETTALEAMLLRKVLRIKLMGSIVFDMIAYNDMLSESLVPMDVESMVRISNHQIQSITTRVAGATNEEMPNKELMVSHLTIAQEIINDIQEQLNP